MVSNEGENLIFIFSLPRSGSTLLGTILSNNSAAYCPPEPWFLLRLAEVYGEPSSDKIFDDYYASIGTRSFIKNELFLDSSRAFAVHIYNSCLAEKGRQIFIDKTPRYYHILSFIDQLFPKAKKIWLKRNPLDVAASYQATWNIGVDILTGKKVEPSSFDLVLGLSSLEKYFSDKSQDKYQVKYEDIVTNPLHQIRQICCFCGIPFHDEMIYYGKNDELLNSIKDSFVGDKLILKHKTVQSDSQRTWQRTLSKDAVNQLVTLIGFDTFARIGYEHTAQELEKRYTPLQAGDEKTNIKEELISRYKQYNAYHAALSEIKDLHGRLQVAETDRAARLEVIQELSQRIQKKDGEIQYILSQNEEKICELHKYDVRRLGWRGTNFYFLRSKIYTVLQLLKGV